jgi:hypothetical protein
MPAGPPSALPPLDPAGTPTQLAAGGGKQPAGGAGGGPASGGSAGDGPPQDPDEPRAPRLDAGQLHDGEKPPPSAPPPRPVRLIGNRDWIIPVECRADGLVVRGLGQKIPLASLTGNAAAESPLLQAVRQMIARRQASVRPGEPPYRPQVRFLIYPDGLRTYFLSFPALEPLGIPLTRQNVEADTSSRPAP